MVSTELATGRHRRAEISSLSSLVTIGFVVAVAAVLGAAHAWTADDGFITFRVARNIAQGHGPVFNMGERVEASTSPLWTWMLGLVAWITPHSLETWAAVLGVTLACGGLLLMMLGCLRGAPRDGRVVLPGAVIILLSLRSFWEFETSGLDIAVSIFWVGLAWWVSVRAVSGIRRDLLVAAGVLGLAAVIRAELILGAAIVLAVLVRSARRDETPRSRSHWLVPLAIFIAPGAAYEVFRVMYYAVLVPTTAIAKEGSRLRLDMVGLHYLWVSLALTLAFIPALCLALFRSGLRSGPKNLTWAFVAAGLVEAAYVVGVGGDYMIGRLLLPAVTLLVAPFAVLRLEPKWVAPAVVLLSAATIVPPFAQLHTLPNPITNFGAKKNWLVQEARYLQHQTKVRRPVGLHDYAQSYVLADLVKSYDLYGRLAEPDGHWRPLPNAADQSIVTTTILGLTGYVFPSEVYVIDLNGLADPVTARIRLDHRGRPGHEKRMGDSFNTIRYGVETTTEAPKPDVCADIKRLYEDVRAPMSWHRAWTNILHAFGNTTMRLRIRDAAGVCAPRVGLG